MNEIFFNLDSDYVNRDNYSYVLQKFRFPYIELIRRVTLLVLVGSP